MDAMFSFDRSVKIRSKSSRFGVIGFTIFVFGLYDQKGFRAETGKLVWTLNMHPSLGLHVTPLTQNLVVSSRFYCSFHFLGNFSPKYSYRLFAFKIIKFSLVRVSAV